LKQKLWESVQYVQEFIFAMQIQLSIFSWILEQEWDHFFLGFLVSPLGYRGMYLAMAGMTILFMIFFLPYY